MDKSDCSICENAFDEADHRPRNLPCGHGFCTQCLKEYIQKGNLACPVCSKEHGSNSATDLPVNFLLEEFLHKAANSTSSNLVEGQGALCPKHIGVPIYFFCKSHKVKVCHSCAVIDHPITFCHLVSLEEEIKRKKQRRIASVQKIAQDMKNTVDDLKMEYQKNVRNITNQKNKKQDLEKEIEQIQLAIVNQEKNQEKIKNAIQECHKKTANGQLMQIALNASISNEDIEKQCDLARAVISYSQKWEETIRNDLNMKKKLNCCNVTIRTPPSSKIFLTKTPPSSKIFMTKRRSSIPSVSKKRKHSFF
ncbi:unnamed protein product, partial [Meganyctiphanes norvegica]